MACLCMHCHDTAFMLCVLAFQPNHQQKMNRLTRHAALRESTGACMKWVWMMDDSSKSLPTKHSVQLNQNQNQNMRLINPKRSCCLSSRHCTGSAGSWILAYGIAYRQHTASSRTTNEPIRYNESSLKGKINIRTTHQTNRQKTRKERRQLRPQQSVRGGNHRENRWFNKQMRATGQ